MNGLPSVLPSLVEVWAIRGYGLQRCLSLHYKNLHCDLPPWQLVHCASPRMLSLRHLLLGMSSLVITNTILTPLSTTARLCNYRPRPGQQRRAYEQPCWHPSYSSASRRNEATCRQLSNTSSTASACSMNWQHAQTKPLVSSGLHQHLLRWFRRSWTATSPSSYSRGLSWAHTRSSSFRLNHLVLCPTKLLQTRLPALRCPVQ